MALIAGTLNNASGVRPNTKIILTAYKTTSDVVTLAPDTAIVTSATGTYSFECKPSFYNVRIQQPGYPCENVGIIQVYSDSVDGTINDFLTVFKPDDLTPEILKQCIAAMEGAEAAQKAAEVAASTAATDAADEFSQQFQDRFNTLAPIPWVAGLKVTNALQVYSHADGHGVERSYLPSPKDVPFTTSATWEEDVALVRFSEEALINKSILIKRFESSQMAYMSDFGLANDAIQNVKTFNTISAELLAKGVDTIYVDKEYKFNTQYDWVEHKYGNRIKNVMEFAFVGSGSLSGLDGVTVNHQVAQNPTVTNGSNIKCFEREILNVVMFGDSISAEWANSITFGCTQWHYICAEFQRQNPDQKINFLNRAIGGQTWGNAMTKPTYFPPWYTNENQNWVDRVIEDAPDVVICAFGMNDTNAFNAGTMVTVIQKIEEALPACHVVIIPCLQPSRSSDYGIESSYSFDSIGGQAGRNYAAGFERTYAQFYGHSVWDLNRYFQQCRNGYDIVDCELGEVSAVSVNGAYRADRCVDFSFECLMSNWTGENIYLEVGGDSEGADKVVIGKLDNGNFTIAGFTEFVGVYHGTGDTGIPVPSTDFYLSVAVINNRFTAYLITDTTEPVHDRNFTELASFNVIRHGGIIRPAIGYAGFVSGCVKSLRVCLGKPKKTAKTITDYDMWGVSDKLPDTKKPYGGNGINHPSTQGLAKVVATVLAAQDMRVKRLTVKLVTSLIGDTQVFEYAPECLFDGRKLSIYGGVAKPELTGELFTINDYQRITRATKTRLITTEGSNAAEGATEWNVKVLSVSVDGIVKTEVGEVKNGVLFNGDGALIS